MQVNSEKKTFLVIVLTLVTMAAEIIAGLLTHSMALFADGWHMGTHALALTLTFMTYVFIRKFANSKTFAFGTGKFSALSGFTSSLLLGLTGIFIIFESAERFINPVKISFNEAIIVAIIGLVVNSLCILIMGTGSCECHHHHHHSHKHEDYNFKAAYMHILADAMTSVFAIAALFTAKYFGWTFLDPIVGAIGGIIICIWALDLIKNTSMILLDSEVKELKSEIAKLCVFDVLHVWKTSDNKISVVAKTACSVDINEIKAKISELANTDSIFIERT